MRSKDSLGSDFVFACTLLVVIITIIVPLHFPIKIASVSKYVLYRPTVRSVRSNTQSYIYIYCHIYYIYIYTVRLLV